MWIVVKTVYMVTTPVYMVTTPVKYDFLGSKIRNGRLGNTLWFGLEQQEASPLPDLSFLIISRLALLTIYIFTLYHFFVLKYVLLAKMQYYYAGCPE